MNNKGLSGVIVTLALVAVAMVAIGIVSMVVINLVDTGGEQINYNQKCLGAVFKVETATLDGTDCKLLIKRLSGVSTEAIGGVDVAINNEISGDSSGDILSSKTVIVNCSGLTDSIINRVDGKIYFLKENNDKHSCSGFSWEA